MTKAHAVCAPRPTLHGVVLPKKPEVQKAFRLCVNPTESAPYSNQVIFKTKPIVAEQLFGRRLRWPDQLEISLGASKVCGSPTRTLPPIKSSKILTRPFSSNRSSCPT